MILPLRKRGAPLSADRAGSPHAPPPAADDFLTGPSFSDREIGVVPPAPEKPKAAKEPEPPPARSQMRSSTSKRR